MAKGKSGSVISTLARWRWAVQTVLLVVWVIPLRLFTVCSPVFHCHACPWAMFACPIGVLANFSYLHTFPFVAIGTLVVYGAVFGSFICGWVCPFGFLQDLLGKIPAPKFELPGWMGYFRYVVLLVLVLAIPSLYGHEHPLFFCLVCPAGGLEAGLATGRSPGTIKIVILAVLLVGVLFVRRPWCTLFCPLGAIYGLFNRVSIFFLRFQPTLCNDCDRCRELCRCGSLADRRAGDQHCIRCLDCAQCDAINVGCVLVPPKD